eukprot:TRINITY_DN2_c0_g1_i1.p1 TRINITY_DN2_c0_g1~~TRINITY_DN2_c0_g1_i1.p1  ORF type:complete len:130 (+),score=52.07 TRINITY_DN2_c0_g1_i1:93-482(+)
MTTQASSDLVWRAVKGNNAFLQKQRFGRGREGMKLSSEPRNALNRSSFKHSGIVHKGANIQIAEDGSILLLGQDKEVTTMPATKVGAAARIARGSRSDLRVSMKAKAARLRRLLTRKSRKSWAKVNKDE